MLLKKGLELAPSLETMMLYLSPCAGAKAFPLPSSKPPFPSQTLSSGFCSSQEEPNKGKPSLLPVQVPGVQAGKGPGFFPTLPPHTCGDAKAKWNSLS